MLSGNITTTYRRGTKKSSTFCVFLLTDFSRAMILRIQIRGSVVAPKLVESRSSGNQF